MKLNNEVWKDIKGYEKLYQVSNLGRVSSLHTGKRKVMKTRILRGYLRVNLAFNKKVKTFQVHRLVADTFIQNTNPSLYTQVHHINGIRDDNRVENLQWCTQTKNIELIDRKSSLYSKIIEILANNHEVYDLESLLDFLSS